jgi:hypothetical protein
VRAREAAGKGGLHVETRLRQLTYAREHTDHLVRHVRWKNWLNHTMADHLQDATLRCAKVNVNLKGIEEALRGSMQRPLTRARDRRVRKGVQAQACRSLAPTHLPCLEFKLRHKLDRWDMGVLPNHRVRRALKVIQSSKGQFNPRVTAALLRTWYNGWCTKRRFQHRKLEGDCIFACCKEAEDSVEHYSVCRALEQLAWKYLHIGRSSRNLQDRRAEFLLPQDAQPDFRDHNSLLGRRMLHMTVAYLTHCSSRHATTNKLGAWAEGAYAQALREVCRGDPHATRLMDTAWSTAESWFFTVAALVTKFFWRSHLLPVLARGWSGPIATTCAQGWVLEPLGSCSTHGHSHLLELPT